jgi:hypothetical protein
MLCEADAGESALDGLSNGVVAVERSCGSVENVGPTDCGCARGEDGDRTLEGVLGIPCIKDDGGGGER